LTEVRRHRTRRPLAAVGILLTAIVLIGAGGCATPPAAPDPIAAYYRYDFPTAREALRPRVEGRVDDQRLLNLLRLGAAGMADGDVVETELAFREAFDLLSTAGLNADRTVAAVLLHEGIRIWKGEPFEQALAYTWIATHYGTRGDWENMRAAAANSLFRLADFGQHMARDTDAVRLVERSAREPDLLESGYTAVDNGFALGQLLTAIGADLSGAGGAGAIFDQVAAQRPDLRDLVRTLRERDYDTLLVVDHGRGPTKLAYGPDMAFVRHEPRERRRGRLVVEADGAPIADAMPIADVDAMARQLRWNALENVRRAKSVLGDVFMLGGITAVAIGADQGSREAMIAGAVAAALGLVMKSGAAADTRHLEALPAAVYLVPLRLDGVAHLNVTVAPPSASRMTMPDFVPGVSGNPRLVYLRLHGQGTMAPAWLVSDDLLYGNDHTTVADGDLPWILGGWDVGTPTMERLAEFQAGGMLQGWTLSRLQRAHADAGITIGAGLDPRGGRGGDAEARRRSFRHVLEGGSALFTPQLHSMGYKRIMFTESAHAPPIPEASSASSATSDAP